MLSNVEYDGGTYSCVYPWSSDSFVKISTSDISYIKEGKMKTKKDVDYKYLFAIFHPIPENISMPDVFIFEKWQKQRIWITGYGINLEEAEKAAVEPEVTTVEERVAKGETYIDGLGQEVVLEADLPQDESKKKTYMIKDESGQIQIKDR
jgi:hypothetical protein